MREDRRSCIRDQIWKFPLAQVKNLRLIQDDCSEVGSTDEEILTSAL